MLGSPDPSSLYLPLRCTLELFASLQVSCLPRGHLRPNPSTGLRSGVADGLQRTRGERGHLIVVVVA